MKDHVRQQQAPAMRAAVTGGAIAGGAVGHLLLVALPPLLGQSSIRWPLDPPVFAFAILVTLFYLSDAVGARSSRSRAASGLVPARYERPNPDGLDRRAPYLAAVTCGLILAMFWVMLWGRLGEATSDFGLACCVGSALMLAGAALRWLAYRELDGAFVTDLAPVTERPLITSGIYARVRHPSETGLLCVVSGAALLLDSVPGLWLTGLVLLPLVLLRIRWEERALRVAYGASYREYQRRVNRLLPLTWLHVSQ